MHCEGFRTANSAKLVLKRSLDEATAAGFGIVKLISCFLFKADHEELWDELVLMSDRLLRDPEEQDWTEFPIEHWERSRVHLDQTKHLHQVPHEGDIEEEEELKVPTEELVSLL